MQGVFVSVTVEDADCMQCGEPTVGISMQGAGVIPIYRLLIRILKGLSVCKLAFFLRRLSGKMHSASIPEALTAIWSWGKVELILKKSPERQEVQVPGLQHRAHRSSDLYLLLAQAPILFRGRVEDVGLAAILQ